MTLRGAVAGAVRPVLGADRLQRIARTERRWRRGLARRVAPAAPKRSRSVGQDGPAGPLTFPAPPLTRHQLLAGLHRVLQPRTYLEIGVNDGRSLRLARCVSIGVDPAFQVTAPICCDVQLVRATSDDYFAGPDPAGHLGGVALDLAFIDGMHLAEFAYRDFLNVEPMMSAAGVVVLDDMLPRDVDEASRDRHTGRWAGDVFKVAALLRELRPDLLVLAVNTRPTGVVVVVGLDPASRVLAERYEQRLPWLQSPDPQLVPDAVLRRTGALDPRTLLADPLWPRLVGLRAVGAGPAEVARELAGLRERTG